MLERPLVPLDGSTIGEQAMTWAAVLARSLDQPIVLFSAVDDLGRAEDPESAAAVRDTPFPAPTEKRIAEAREYLAAHRQRLVDEGVETVIDVVVGDPRTEIIAAAVAHRAGLIVMTTRPRPGRYRWFRGGVVDRVLRTSPVPVLVVPSNDSGADPSPAVRHLILPLDGTSEVETAVPVAMHLARILGIPLTVVRALDVLGLSARGVEPKVVTTLEESAREYLAGIGTRMGASNTTPVTSLSLSSPLEAIEAIASSTPGSLIVMSSHGRSALSRALRGGLTNQVIRDSLHPVMVVPPRSRVPPHPFD